MNSIAVGRGFVRRIKSFRTINQVEYSDLSVQAVAALTAIMGGLTGSAVMPALTERLAILERFSPVFVRPAANRIRSGRFCSYTSGAPALATEAGCLAADDLDPYDFCCESLGQGSGF